MNIIVWIIIITSAAGVFGTGLGGILSCCLRQDSDKTVSLFLSFAGGVMLGVVCFDLIPDALNPENAAGKADIFLTSAGILLGYFVIYLLNQIIDQTAYNRSSRKKSIKPLQSSPLRSKLYQSGIVMALAIALHNLPEGLVIGAAFASDAAGQAVKYTGSGLVLAFVIGLHDIPEGMAIAVPLIGGGMGKVKAAAITALSGVPTVIGALIGYTAGMMSAFALSLSLSFASGAMLFVIFGELLPESFMLWRSKLPALASLIGVLTGMIIIFTG